MKTGYKVSDAMTFKPVIVNKNTDLQTVAQTMDENKVAGLLVGAGEVLEGILTEKDIVRKVVAKGTNPLELKAEDVMSTEVTTIEPDKDIFEAIVLMRDNNVRHLPVVYGKKLQGILTMKDILKIEPQLFEIIVDKLRIREENRKPVHHSREEGVCELCGEFSDVLHKQDDSLVCDGCFVKVKEG